MRVQIVRQFLGQSRLRFVANEALSPFTVPLSVPPESSQRRSNSRRPRGPCRTVGADIHSLSASVLHRRPAVRQTWRVTARYFGSESVSYETVIDGFGEACTCMQVGSPTL